MNRRDFLRTAIGSSLARVSLAASNQTLIIDSHVHVWKHDPAFPFAEGANVPDFDITAEDLLRLMEAHNVARTVLIQVIHYRWDNRYLLDVLHRYPNRFQGVCRVNPEDPAAPDHLSMLTQQGFRGVRLSPDASAKGDWIRGSVMPPLWRRCSDLRVPMTLLIPVTRLPDVIPWIEQNPELTVVVDHMADCPVGDPKKLQLLLAMARYPKLYVKISHIWSLSKLPYPYPDAAEQVARLRDAFGADRLMWGTDWPIAKDMLSYDQRIALYRNHLPFLSATERSEILYRSVQRVWPFGL